MTTHEIHRNFPTVHDGNVREALNIAARENLEPLAILTSRSTWREFVDHHLGRSDGDDDSLPRTYLGVRVVLDDLDGRAPGEVVVNARPREPEDTTGKLQAWIGDRGTIVLTSWIDLPDHPAERFHVGYVRPDDGAPFVDAVRRLQQACTAKALRVQDLEERLDIEGIDE